MSDLWNDYGDNTITRPGMDRRERRNRLENRLRFNTGKIIALLMIPTFLAAKALFDDMQPPKPTTKSTQQKKVADNTQASLTTEEMNPFDPLHHEDDEEPEVMVE